MGEESPRNEGVDSTQAYEDQKLQWAGEVLRLDP